jgi:PadR family transcriptional regulator PadR
LSSPASGDWASQLRRGVLELCILRLLARAPSYGYEIVSALNRYPSLAAGENTVYPLLRRLRQDGALETFTRESPNGPARQYYRCTRDGERRLRQLESDWKDMAADVATFLKEGRP